MEHQSPYLTADYTDEQQADMAAQAATILQDLMTPAQLLALAQAFAKVAAHGYGTIKATIHDHRPALLLVEKSEMWR